MLGLEVSDRLILVSLGSLHSLQGVQLEMINAIMNNDAKIDFVVFMFVGFCWIIGLNILILVYMTNY